MIPAKIGIAFAAILISGFTVYASNVNEAEPNNAYSTSDTIYANDTVSGSVGPQDLSDFYEITVANTGKLKVKPLATTIGQDYSVWVYIYTPTVSGAGSVTSSYVSAAGTDTLSLSIDPGTYYIRIYNNAATNYKFTTVFKTQEEVANDVGPNEVADSATTIGLDQVVTGRVGYWRGSSTALGNKDKQDYYKIAVTNTGILKVKPQVMTVGQGDSILVEIIPALGIAATGGVYRTYSDTTTDTLAFPVEPGTYYVLIKGDFDGTNYKFITTFQTQEEVPVDVEPNNSGDSAIPIVFGQVLTGRIGYWSPPISATDRMDFYKIIVTNTGILKVKPQAMTIGQNYSIRVDITGANWLTTLTGKAVSSAATDTLAFPVEPGTYYIRIFYYENDPALTYFITNYKFTTSFQTQEDVPVDVELNDTFSHAATIGLNQVVTGRIGYYSPNFSTVDSSDYYKIAIATAG
ncbi:MAG: hypothetical protein JF616_18055, partial [Fibrobacteres bacterium]|nr:hypothetical protein [Fibrobacterota bacterium]